MGADFASGFFFGVKIGGFNPVDLFECMKKEKNAYTTFFNADIEIKKGI